MRSSASPETSAIEGPLSKRALVSGSQELIQIAKANQKVTPIDCSVDARQTHAPEAAGAQPRASRSCDPAHIKESWHHPAQMRIPPVGRCIYEIDVSTVLMQTCSMAPPLVPQWCRTCRRSAIFLWCFGALYYTHIVAPRTPISNLSYEMNYG